MKVSIRELWEDLETYIVPKGASDVQRIEVKKAFYAGFRTATVEVFGDFVYDFGDQGMIEFTHGLVVEADALFGIKPHKEA
jgi:hypothetical protein